jgi:hypothetical protein
MILALDVDVQLYYSYAALRAHHSSLGLAEANESRQPRTIKPADPCHGTPTGASFRQLCCHRPPCSE